MGEEERASSGPVPDVSIDVMGLTPQTVLCLMEYGLLTSTRIEEFTRDRELEDLPGFGAKRVDEVERALARLRMLPPDEVPPDDIRERIAADLRNDVHFHVITRKHNVPAWLVDDVKIALSGSLPEAPVAPKRKPEPIDRPKQLEVKRRRLRRLDNHAKTITAAMRAGASFAAIAEHYKVPAKVVAEWAGRQGVAPEKHTPHGPHLKGPRLSEWIAKREKANGPRKHIVIAPKDRSDEVETQARERYEQVKQGLRSVADLELRIGVATVISERSYKKSPEMKALRARRAYASRLLADSYRWPPMWIRAAAGQGEEYNTLRRDRTTEHDLPFGAVPDDLLTPGVITQQWAVRLLFESHRDYELLFAAGKAAREVREETADWMVGMGAWSRRRVNELIRHPKVTSVAMSGVAPFLPYTSPEDEESASVLLAGTPIDHLWGLTTRSRNALRRGNILNAQELANATDEELRDIRGVGEVTLAEIKGVRDRLIAEPESLLPPRRTVPEEPQEAPVALPWEIAETPVDSLEGLTVRSRNSLKRNKILKAQDLVDTPEGELRDIRGVGASTLAEITAVRDRLIAEAEAGAEQAPGEGGGQE